MSRSHRAAFSSALLVAAGSSARGCPEAGTSLPLRARTGSAGADSRRRTATAGPAAARAASAARPQQPPPATSSSRRRASAAGSTTSASTSSSPTRTGEPVLDLKQDDFTARRGQQAAEGRHLQRRQDRRGRAASRRGPPRAIRNDFDEEREARAPTCGCSSSCSTTTTCAAATTWRSRKPLIDFVQNQLAPADMVAMMYPLTPVTDLRFTRNRDATHPGDQRSSRGASSTTSRATRSRSSTRTTRPAWSSASATRSRWTRSKARRSGWAACAKGASRSSSSARGSRRRCRRS